MKVKTIVETIETVSTTPPEFRPRPIGAEIDHPDAWILCTLDEPLAEPADDEAGAKVKEHQAFQQSVRQRAEKRKAAKRGAKLKRRTDREQAAAQARLAAFAENLAARE